MKAIEFVEEIIGTFGTNDVFAIARLAGVKIVYESWHSVTIGEFERKTKTIRVNKRALTENRNVYDLEKVIIAHELGHYFAADLNLEKSEEEKFAHEFAENLLKNKKLTFTQKV